MYKLNYGSNGVSRKYYKFRNSSTLSSLRPGVLNSIITVRKNDKKKKGKLIYCELFNPVGSMKDRFTDNPVQVDYLSVKTDD